MLDVEWIPLEKICLYTGGSGLGCGCNLNDTWSLSVLKPGILKNITYLEMIQIALAAELQRVRIQFCTDNMACLHILSSKSGKSDRIMKLVRAIEL